MYKVIQVVTVKGLAEEMGQAEKDGYTYVGSVEMHSGQSDPCCSGTGSLVRS